jgi:hypothetical protein
VPLSVITQQVSITVTADADHAVEVDGEPVTPGEPSAMLPMNLGANTVKVTVTDGDESRTYTLTLTRSASPAQWAYLKASNTDELDEFGYALAVSGDTVAVGVDLEDGGAREIDGNQNSNSAPSAGAVYVFVRTDAGWEQQAYLKADNADSMDYFGCSVALEGDVLAVGANGEASAATGVNGDADDNGAPASGAVYVFERNKGEWRQQAYLKAGNAGAGDWFGTRVALEGNTLAVGASGEDSSLAGVDPPAPDNDAESDAGAVYVFTRSGDAWSQQAYLKASNPGAGDYFGQDVALSRNTLAVGVWSEDSSATGIGGSQNDDGAADSGAVYVFTRDAGTWSQQAYLKADNADAGDWFGGRVALSGDLLAVGASGESNSARGVDPGGEDDDSAGGSGAAYVYSRSGTTWSRDAYLKASNAEVLDSFGLSLALTGDVLAVGAPWEQSNATGVGGNQDNNGASDSGAVYVFSRGSGGWKQRAYLKASNTSGLDQFGSAVALSPDTLVVGARLEDGDATGVDGDQDDDSATDSGAGYVFR